MVDFPLPDGPRMVTISISFGLSSTQKVTSLIAVKPLSYVFETFSNWTMGANGCVAGVGAGGVTGATVGVASASWGFSAVVSSRFVIQTPADTGTVRARRR